MLLDSIFNNKKDINYEFCLNLKEEQYKKYIMKLYNQKMGYSFNIKKAQTLNEYIQYLKLYDNIKMKEYLSNKVNVYDYVTKELGSSKFVKELYNIYDDINEVNYDELPDKFMIKLNNSCRANFPVLNKQNITNEIKKYINEYFTNRSKINYAFVNGFELQYKNIKPKIIVERLYPKVTEWQILCMNGNPLFVCFLDEKHSVYNKIYKLDKNFHLIDNILMKKKVEELIEISKILSKDFKLVRIDFFMVDDKYPFFGEYTFTPYSGYASKDITEYNSREYSSRFCKIEKG